MMTTAQRKGHLYKALALFSLVLMPTALGNISRSLNTPDPPVTPDPPIVIPIPPSPGGTNSVPPVVVSPPTPGHGSGGGDPHFITFNGVAYSYHGECDLIMLSNATLAAGISLDLHIRTTYRKSRNARYTKTGNARYAEFSFISGVALKIGNDNFQVEPDGSTYVNGQLLVSDGMSDANGIITKLVGYAVTKAIKNTKRKIMVFDVMLDRGNSIQIRANTKNGIMFVDVNGSFPNAVGLLGNSANHGLIGCDGVTDFTNDWKAFGEEWQVQFDEPKLFHTNRAPQHPDTCRYEVAVEANTHERHLRRAAEPEPISKEQAAEACANVPNGHKKQFCIADVKAMGDINLGEDPFYN